MFVPRRASPKQRIPGQFWIPSSAADRNGGGTDGVREVITAPSQRFLRESSFERFSATQKDGLPFFLLVLRRRAQQHRNDRNWEWLCRKSLLQG
jgi:hypothetical protein